MSVDQKVSKERILQGAEDILCSGNYADMTVDALARSLRMSKSTLYKYFPSKEDVVVALIREACERAERDLAQIVEQPSAGGQLTALAEVFERYGERMPRALLIESDKVPPASAARIRHTREAFAASAIFVVNGGLASGEFGAADAHTVAVAFVASAEAVLLDGARRGIQGYPARVRQLPDLFLPALRASPGAYSVANT